MMIETLTSIAPIITRWRAAQSLLGFTNGNFDLLHYGHIQSLQFAHSFCDYLIVAIDNDAMVRAQKGAGRPIVPVVERSYILASLKLVDAVVVFGKGELEPLVALIKPDIMVKGAEYLNTNIVGAEHAKKVVYAPMSGHSTSAIINRIRE